MTEDIKNKLLMCAEIYHCADFITSDPVQFPHRYTLKQDIEIKMCIRDRAYDVVNL